MNTKRFFVICVLLLLLFALIPFNAMAQGGLPRRGKPSPTPTHTVTPSPTPVKPPIPTETPDTGSLYGDLYVILRDENGLPILNSVTLDVPPGEEGSEGGTIVVKCIQPISTMDGTFTIATYYGELVITVYAGEPFALPSYYDPLGDLVECELPDTMADLVQSVDFGRLNLGRAPDAVIAHAFDEAIKKMNLASAFDLDPAGRLMMQIDGDWFTIDAPAENLALYIKLMTDGHWITLDTTPIEPGGGGNGGDGGGPPPGDGPSTEPRPVLSDNAIGLLGAIGYANLGDITNDPNNHDLLLAASLLAGSADKTGTITLDEVIYINSIYGINQLGTLVDESGNMYYDFSIRDGGNPYSQNRLATYGNRTSGGCGAGAIWVLQPEAEPYHYLAQCVSILGKVHFNNYHESYSTIGVEYDYDDNVRGFAQSADDALQVIEYIHNYEVPVDLYVE